MLIKDHIIEGKNIHQRLYKFRNNFGASVVIDKEIKNINGFLLSKTYGGELGLFELAVLKYTEEDKFELCYTTEITDNVIGYLTEKEIQEYLKKISKLKI